MDAAQGHATHQRALNERLLIFTEYADTKRWLQEQLESLIAGSDRERECIATFHGGIGDEKREALKRSFNSPPEPDPLRILIATDAAREGVNLQNHCRYLFHLAVPWNPRRMEQRNGRIDRNLQRAPEVFCHCFVLADRDEDRVLDVLVKKTEEIRKTPGSLPAVVVGRLSELLAKGINPTAISEEMAQIQGLDHEEGCKRRQALFNLELEDNSRQREDELRLETSLRERLPSVQETIQRQLRAQLPADVALLKERLEALASERAERAKAQLGKRAEDEANAFVKVLREQRERILKTRTKHDSEFEQLAFGFADHELRQLRDNRSYWDRRLARIERDLELEPSAIRRTFEVATAPRIEPAGAIVLWPLQVSP